MKSETQNWINLAQVDYEDSLYLHKASRHPNSIYLMCQAVEKLLKGAQVEFANLRPKKIHDLEVLAHNSGLKFVQEDQKFLKDLTSHYERVRYRDLGQAHYNTKRKVEPIIEKGQKLYLWILKQFPDH